MMPAQLLDDPDLHTAQPTGYAKMTTEVSVPELAGPAAGDEDRRWKALVVLAALQFMLVLDATVVNIALPSIKRDLGFSQANLAWVVDAYLLVAGGFLLLGGRLADLFGRRRIFLAGAVAFALGSLASGLAQDQGTLIAARALQGTGEALAGPAALSIIAILFTDPKERAKALGIWGGLAGLAGVVGAVLSGVIVDVASWRWIFWVNLPVAAAVIIVAPRILRPDKRARDRGFDLIGAATATAGITALVYALLEASRDGWSSATTIGLLAGGATLLGTFLVVEARAQNPLVPLGFFALRRRSAASALMALTASALYAFFFLLTLYMQLVLHWSPLRTGFAMLPFGFAILVGIGASSKLVPRVGARPILVTGMSIAAGGFGLLTRLSVNAHYFSQEFPAMALVALGMGLTLVALIVSGVSEADEHDAGLASGTITTAQQVGGALGLAVLVSVATDRATGLLATGHSTGAAQLAGSHLAFGVGAGTLLGGAILSALLIGKFRPAPASTGTSNQDRQSIKP